MLPSQLPLNALRAFEAAARHESYTRAAVELSLTQSAVSRQVQALEQQLGVILFRREGRTVKLSTKVDPELLGGLVVTIGSKRIDGSIRTRLNSLAQAMKG